MRRFLAYVALAAEKAGWAIPCRNRDGGVQFNDCGCVGCLAIQAFANWEDSPWGDADAEAMDESEASAFIQSQFCDRPAPASPSETASEGNCRMCGREVGSNALLHGSDGALRVCADKWDCHRATRVRAETAEQQTKELQAEVERLRGALRYIAGEDVAGMDAHLRSEDVARSALSHSTGDTDGEEGR